jgi:hypothetical protein
VPLTLADLPRVRGFGPHALELPDLRIDGIHWRDGDALFVPRFVSALSILGHLIRGDEASAVAFLDWASLTGFNGIRVFAGALTWANQSAQAAAGALPRLLELAADRGLVVEVTAITGSADRTFTPIAHLRDVAVAARAAMARYGRRFVLLEIANEVGHPTQSAEVNRIPTLRAWGRDLCAGLLWAVGAAGVDEPDVRGVYPAHGGTFNTAHLDRSRPRWANIRRVRELFAVVTAHGVPCLDNERMGADELDGRVTGRQRWADPAVFFAAGALNRAFAGVGGVHHSQAGLEARVPAPGSVQEACARAEVAGHALVAGVAQGQPLRYLNAGHDGSPVPTIPPAEWARVFGEADGRCYSFVHGDRGVTVAIGIAAGVVFDLPLRDGWRALDDVTYASADGTRVTVYTIGR